MKVGVVSRPIMGFEVNGDAYLYKESDNQSLIAVIDGLGHGMWAHEASERARNFVEKHAIDDLEEIVWGCHKHIENTQGVAMGLVRVERRKKISCCGIGNIKIHIIGKETMHPFSMDGIVGNNIRKVLKFEYPYEAKVIVLLHSDGVSTRFSPSMYPDIQQDPQHVAQQIIEKWGKENDDATILIAIENG